MKYRLQDLIDMELFQSLQDRLNEIYSFPSAIIDTEGTILTATAWQDICTKFHRQNKVCEKECIKSDQYISDHLAEANPAVSYRCPHGLVDNATPIIIDGKHLANFFTGQFFLEKPDLEFFRKQAMKYGFDEEAYLAAVRKVPVWTQEQLNSYLFFIKGLIEVMANIGLKNLRTIETGKKIQESEERFQMAMRGSNDGLWDWDLSTDEVYYSPRWMSMLGYGPDELEHNLNTWKRLVHPDDQEQALTAVRSLLEGQSDKYEVEFRMQHKDGSFRHILSRAFFADDAAGNHKRLVGTHVDITERKRAGKAIKESEANLNSLINCRDESIWSIDRNYNYIFFNTFFRDAYLAEYNRELMRGMNAIEILTPSMQALWKTKYDSALAGQKTVFEFSAQTGNDLKFYEVYLNPILLEGKITGASALSLDITARKKIDDARMFLVECGSKGEDFFRSLARYLARSLDMDYVCIDSLEGDLLTARTVAIYVNGRFEDNVSYTLHDTPCGELVGKDVCCFPEGVRQRFLTDAVLQEMKAESYIGVTLWSYDHRPIGLIAVIGQRPLADPEFAESILKLAAIRAAGELERRKADEALSHSHDLMRYIIEEAPT